MATEPTTPESAVASLAKQSARGGDDEAKQRQAREQQELVEAVNARIAVIRNIPDHFLSPSEKELMINDLRAAMSGGTLLGVSNTMQRTRTDVQERVALNEVETNISFRLEDLDPSYAGYSPRAQRYMSKLFDDACKNSPELQALRTQYDALPDEKKESAKKEIGENWKKLKELRDNPQYAHLKDELDDFKTFKLANSAQGKKILEMVEQGKSREEIRLEIEESFKTRVEAAETAVNGQLPRLSKDTQDYLRSNFGRPDGTLDMRKAMEAYGSINENDRRAAIEAAAAGKELTAEQQKIVHLTKVIAIVDGAAPIQGAIDIIKRQDLEKTAQLTDRSVPVEQRAEILIADMRAQGLSVDSKFARASAIDMIETLDKPGAVALIQQGKYSEVGKLYQQSIISDFMPQVKYGEGLDFNSPTLMPGGVSLTGAGLLTGGMIPPPLDIRIPTGNGAPASSAGMPSFNLSFDDSILMAYAHAQTEGTVPDWKKNNPDAVKQEEAAVKSWRQIEQDIMAKYEANTKANPETTPVPTAAPENVASNLRAMDNAMMAGDTPPASPAPVVAGAEAATPAPTIAPENVASSLRAMDNAMVAEATPAVTEAPKVASAADLRKFENETAAPAPTTAPVVAEAKAEAPTPATDVPPEPKPAVVAATVVAPPPGIDPKDIPSLAALGVTGGQSVGGDTTTQVVGGKAKEVQTVRD